MSEIKAAAAKPQGVDPFSAAVQQLWGDARLDRKSEFEKLSSGIAGRFKKHGAIDLGRIFREMKAGDYYNYDEAHVEQIVNRVSDAARLSATYVQCRRTIPEVTALYELPIEKNLKDHPPTAEAMYSLLEDTAHYVTLQCCHVLWSVREDAAKLKKTWTALAPELRQLLLDDGLVHRDVLAKIQQFDAEAQKSAESSVRAPVTKGTIDALRQPSAVTGGRKADSILSSIVDIEWRVTRLVRDGQTVDLNPNKQPRFHIKMIPPESLAEIRQEIDKYISDGDIPDPKLGQQDLLVSFGGNGGINQFGGWGVWRPGDRFLSLVASGTVMGSSDEKLMQQEYAVQKVLHSVRATALENGMLVLSDDAGQMRIECARP